VAYQRWQPLPPLRYRIVPAASGRVRVSDLCGPPAQTTGWFDFGQSPLAPSLACFPTCGAIPAFRRAPSLGRLCCFGGHCVSIAVRVWTPLLGVGPDHRLSSPFCGGRSALCRHIPRVVELAYQQKNCYPLRLWVCSDSDCGVTLTSIPISGCRPPPDGRERGFFNFWRLAQISCFT
jgi:hypothetical protein